VLAADLIRFELVGIRALQAAVVAIIVFAASLASAAKLALPGIHGESDVADEAGAVTMLVRSALMRDARTLVQPDELPERMTAAAAPATLAKIGADVAIFGELVREGTGLRVTLILVDKDGQSKVVLVRGGDGDVRGLAKSILEHVKEFAHVTPGPLPAIGLGRLRPYVAAGRAFATDPVAAATALADAIPTTANAAPGATWGLLQVVAKQEDPKLKLVAARALGARQEVDAVAANAKPPVAAIARALGNADRAKISDADAALATITGKDAKDGFALYARTVLADAHGAMPQMTAAIKDALATDAITQRMILAFASRTDAPKFPPETHKALIAFAEKSAPPGVASRIGLAAARAGVEVQKALALVHARDLDDADLAPLEGLVSSGTDATALRLRAELAMRRADGTEGVAIEAFVKEVPDDRVAHLYKGYALMSEGKHDAAAAQFDSAGAQREEAHAQMLANDLEAAIETIARSPVTPEELVVSAQIAIKENRIADAQRDVAIAEGIAPASPYVHDAIADVAAAKGSTISPEQAAFARTIADTGTAEVDGSATVTVKTTDHAVGSGSAGSGASIVQDGSGSGSAASKPAGKIDPRLANLNLGPLLGALPQLGQLMNRRVAIAQLAWDPPMSAWKTPTPENLRPVLEHALSQPPYRLQVSVRPVQAERPLVASRLDQVLGDGDALLLYHVEPDSGQAKIVLEIFVRNAKASREVSDTFPPDGLLAFAVGKLVPFGIAALALVLVGMYFVVRGSGTIRVSIDRAPDASDEVYCVVVTKSSSRPQVSDPVTFRNARKKEGTITKRRSATLVSNGHEVRVPPGTWWVHVYGTYERGGVVLALPASASQSVLVKRGDSTPAKVDLVPKAADLAIVIEGDHKDGVAVKIDDGPAQYTDASGSLVVSVPMGNHVLTFEAKGLSIKRDVATPQARIYRYAFNLARELRIVEAGLDGSSAVSQPVPTTERAGSQGPSPEEIDDIILSNPPAGAADTMAAPGQAAKVSLPAELMGDAMKAIADANAAAGSPAKPAADRTMALASKTVVDDRLLDRYRKTAELGRGAMGVVHRAWDENLEREVAIKVMADDLQKNPEAMRLFQQEAKALAQLNHTNIVTVYDQVTVADKTYMIMEYVDGTTLEKLAEGRGAFPVKDAIEIADQVCAGLAYAHARRVIHRDIKPANIFIARDGTVKLGDFGLARVVRELTIRKTEIRGTPLYMAPEQITGNDLDHRVDLYAVGCTLYELLCGKPPFIEGDILYHQLHTPPIAPSKKRAGIPAALDTLLLALLAKTADGRPPTANDVRTALKKI